MQPGNVVFDLDGSLRICDFGLAIDLAKDDAVTRVGTLGVYEQTSCD